MAQVKVGGRPKKVAHQRRPGTQNDPPCSNPTKKKAAKLKASVGTITGELSGLALHILVCALRGFPKGARMIMPGHD